MIHEIDAAKMSAHQNIYKSNFDGCVPNYTQITFNGLYKKLS